MTATSMLRQAAIIRKSARDRSVKSHSAGGAIIAQCLTCGSPISEMSVIIGVDGNYLRDVLNGLSDLSAEHSERAALWLALCWWRHCWRMGAEGSDDPAELAAIVSCTQSISVVSADFLEDLITALEDADLDLHLGKDSIVTIDIFSPGEAYGESE